MSRIKKLTSLLAIFSLLMVLIMVPAGATAIPTTEPYLYIQTLQCPAGVMQFAQENVGKYVLSMDSAYGITSHEFDLGSPFSFSNAGSDIFTSRLSVIKK